MEKDETDESFQNLLAEFEIGNPAKKCDKGNHVTHVCINKSCELNALICQQ